MKDYRRILAQYGFQDEHGNTLENCGDYVDLLSEVAEQRKALKQSMKSARNFGWKTYLVAACTLVLSVYALVYGRLVEGLIGSILAFSLIALRDALAKLQQSVDSNSRSLRDVRATLESITPRSR